VLTLNEEDRIGRLALASVGILRRGSWSSNSHSKGPHADVKARLASAARA
jgi:hypothetical protein